MFTCRFNFPIERKYLRDKRRPIVLTIDAELNDGNFAYFDPTPLSLRHFEINNVEDVALKIKERATKIIRHKMSMAGGRMLNEWLNTEPGSKGLDR